VNDAVRLAQLALLGEAADCVERVAIFVWDDDRNYVAVNDAATQLVGRSREEILQMRVGDMSPNRGLPHFEDVQHRALSHGTSQLLRDDGVVVDIEWITCPTKVAGLPYMVSICWRKDEP
jgi:PAS domain S-box-containing protein